MTPTLLTEREDRSSQTTSFLSHSQINRYLTCPEQYRLHYVARLRARFSSANLAFGQVIHLALAGLFGNAADPVQLFEDTWKSVVDLDLSYSKRDTWKRFRESGCAILEKFVREEAPRITNVVAVEKRFEIAVTCVAMPFVGFIDLVADLDGRRTVIDFKTASSSYAPHDVLLSDQLTVYQVAEPEAEQVALCTLVRTKEPRIEWHLSPRTPEQLTEYLEKAEHVSHEITSGHFYKRSGLWCSWCDFLPVCLGDEAKVRETLIQVR